MISYGRLFSPTRLLIGAAVAVALLLALPATGAAAQEETQSDAPVITFQNPVPGDVISRPAFAIQFCFAEPVNTKDAHEGGDFRISVRPPGQFGLGLRTVFQGDGWGVAVYANNADADTPDGIWTVEYRFTDPETLAPLDSQFTFTVDQDEGRHIPQATPPACLPGGQTATHGPDYTDPTEEPPKATMVATPTASPLPADEGDDGTDTLLIALVGASIAGIAGIVAGMAYLARGRRPAGG